MPSFFWTQKQDIGPSHRTSHGLTYDGERKRVGSQRLHEGLSRETASNFV
jgi:hypothetical protein